MAFVTRRSFLTQAALGPLAAAQITSLPLFGSMRRATPVSIKAEVGCLFPSIDLLNKLPSASGDTPSAVAHRSSERLGPDSSTRVDLAFVFPGAHSSKHRGVLQPEEKQHVVDQISAALKKECGYESVDLDVASAPCFWYPFHNHAVVCCRISVRT
jgi:hypothetical protein